MFGYVISIGFDLVFHIERNGRRSLEDEFVLIGTIGRKLGGIRSPLSICSAVQVLFKGILFRGSTVDLPFALGINSLRASSLIHEFALFPLSINYYSIIGPAGCFQHTAVGIFPIVVHPITQGDGAFGAGGSQLDFAAFSVCPGAGFSIGIRRSIDFDSMNGQIASRVNGYIVQIVAKGRIRIPGGFYIGAAGMDFAAYGYLTTIDIYTMIRINGTVIVFCSSILGVAGSHRTRTGINLDRIQFNRFADIALKRNGSAAGLDIQAGVVQVGFLDEAYGGSPINSGIIPGIIVAIAHGQKGRAIVRLSAATPAGPLGIAIDLFPIIGLFKIFVPVRFTGVPEFCSLRPVFIGDKPFGPGHPIESVLMAGIGRILGIGIGIFIVGLVAHTGPHATDPEGFLGVGSGEGVLQCRSNGSQIAVPGIGTSTGLGQFFTGKPVMGNERTDVTFQRFHFGGIIFNRIIGHQIGLCIGVAVGIFYCIILRLRPPVINQPFIDGHLGSFRSSPFHDERVVSCSSRSRCIPAGMLGIQSRF